MTRKVIIIFSAIIFLTTLYPSLARSYKWSSNAHGLIILASLNESDFTYSPYSNNGGIVNPSTAVWLLENFDYPYSENSKSSISEGIPLIIWAGRGIGLNDKDAEERIYKIIRHLILRGEPVDASYDGLTALHESILFNQPRYLQLLLDSGADPLLKIVRPGKDNDGHNAFQLYELLKTKKQDSMDVIGEILSKHNA